MRAWGLGRCAAVAPDGGGVVNSAETTAKAATAAILYRLAGSNFATAGRNS